MIKAIIFDIDGVLVDSFEANHQFIKDITKSLKLKQINKLQYKKHFALSFRELIKLTNNISNTKQVDKMVEAAVKRITYPNHLLKAYADCQKTLKLLGKKYKLGLVTGRQFSGLQLYFKQANNQNLFKTAVTLNDVKNHKPHPESLLLAAKRLKVKPEQAVYVGDAESDMLAAKAAGMKSIIFNNKSIKGADASISHFKELIPVINKIEN